MINNSENKPWHAPTDRHGFLRCISDLLEQLDMETNIKNLNEAIVTTLLDSQKVLAENTKGRNNQ